MLVEEKLSVKSSDDSIAIAILQGENILIKSGNTEGTAIITLTSEATGEYGINTTTYIATVKKGTLDVVVTPYDGIYDLEAHGITVVCNQEGAIIEYSNDGINYNSEKPTYTDLGIYQTYYKVSKEGYETLEGSSTTTIKCKTTKCEGPFTTEIDCTECGGKGYITKLGAHSWTYTTKWQGDPNYAFVIIVGECCGTTVYTGTKYITSCTACGYSGGHNHACGATHGLAYARETIGNTCTKNATTSTCTNCENGKLTINIKCEHDMSETHYYCEHGTNYDTEYHT